MDGRVTAIHAVTAAREQVRFVRRTPEHPPWTHGLFPALAHFRPVCSLQAGFWAEFGGFERPQLSKGRSGASVEKDAGQQVDRLVRAPLHRRRAHRELGPRPTRDVLGVPPPGSHRETLAFHDGDHPLGDDVAG